MRAATWTRPRWFSSVQLTLQPDVPVPQPPPNRNTLKSKLKKCTSAADGDGAAHTTHEDDDATTAGHDGGSDPQHYRYLVRVVCFAVNPVDCKVKPLFADPHSPSFARDFSGVVEEVYGQTCDGTSGGRS